MNVHGSHYSKYPKGGKNSCPSKDAFIDKFALLTKWNIILTLKGKKH
jgi:hypothetical protein